MLPCANRQKKNIESKFFDLEGMESNDSVLKMWQSSVCLIKRTDGRVGTGFLIKLNKKRRIITSFNILPTKIISKYARAYFDYGIQDIRISFNASKFITGGEELGFAMIGYKDSTVIQIYKRRHFLIENIRAVSVPMNVYILYYTEGRRLRQTLARVTKVNNSIVTYLCRKSEISYGSPVVTMNGNLIALHCGEEKGTHFGIMMSTIVTKDKTLSVPSFLRYMQMAKYIENFEKFREKGYCDMDKLRMMPDQDWKELVASTGLKIKDSKKLRIKLQASTATYISIAAAMRASKVASAASTVALTASEEVYAYEELISVVRRKEKKNVETRPKETSDEPLTLKSIIQSVRLEKPSKETSKNVPGVSSKFMPYFCTCGSRSNR